jgi:hypothetical protein
MNPENNEMPGGVMAMKTGTPPAAPAGGMEGGRRKTAWMTHVKATMRANKGKSLMQVLKMAKKTYKKAKKGMRGGGADITPYPLVGGRRRRGTRRSRRGGNE